MPDILFIVVLALVIFGPRRLPELASNIGRYLAQFRRLKRELTDQMEAEMSKIGVAEQVVSATSASATTSAQNVSDLPQVRAGISLEREPGRTSNCER